MKHGSLRNTLSRLYSRFNFKWTLLVLILLPVFTVFVLSASYAMQYVESILERRLQKDVELIAQALKEPVVDGLKSDNIHRVKTAVHSALEIQDVYNISIYDHRGQLLHSFGQDRQKDRRKTVVNELSNQKTFREYQRLVYEDVYSYFIPLNKKDQSIGILNITRKESEIKNDLYHFRLAALLIIGSTSLILGGLIFLITRLVIERPLNSLLQGMNIIETQDKTHRPSVRGPREIQRLTSTFNSTLDSLQYTQREISLRKKREKELENQLSQRTTPIEIKNLKKLKSENHPFHGIVGNTQPMLNLFEQITYMAQGQSPVLIYGESGTGKELVARALHQESKHHHKPFIPVNCASLPPDIIESELFGHEKGAFTGAITKRKGLFEEASGGTLFLDEITEMPFSLQAKLLRVIQEKTFRPVGGEERTTHVRLITATNRDLDTALAQQKIRHDLYYRLEAFSLYVPPLREHIEDIDPLIRTFLREMNQTLDKEVHSISKEALEALRQYNYPGNIRELKNLVERAVTFCQANQLQLAHFPSRIQQKKSPASANYSGTATHQDSFCSTIQSFWPSHELPTLEELEKRYIQEVLKESHDNKKKASLKLGISRKKLYNELNKSTEAPDHEA